jgi:sugar-specific transcriptional regulator TrmB
MLYKRLQNAGLNENEAKIYLAALELGQTSVGRIAKKAGIKRTTVYLSLENLMHRGLVSAIKNGGKLNYYAEDPRNLERIMEEKKQNIARLIPELLAFTNLIDKKPEIRYFEGEDGMKEVLKDSLEYPGTEICMLFSESYISDFGDEFFFQYYRPERVARKISSRALLPDNAQMRQLAARDQYDLRQSRLIPSDLFKIKIEIMIYSGRKVSIVSYVEKFALIIESQQIYESLKSIFETIWVGAKRPE